MVPVKELVVSATAYSSDARRTLKRLVRRWPIRDSDMPAIEDAAQKLEMAARFLRQFQAAMTDD